MGSPSLYSARKTALALAVALSFAWQAPVFAHGGEAHMVPMDETLKEFGADVQWDDYAQLFTLIKDGAYVKVKPGAQTAIVNGQPLALQVPVVMKDNKAWVSDTFINDVFQSGLDQTFQVEKRPHPLNALTADEIKQAVEIVKASADFKPNTRFTEISRERPEKKPIWPLAWKNNKLANTPKSASIRVGDNIFLYGGGVHNQKNSLLPNTKKPPDGG
ncbi:primary-amine oxidase, partial [Escherichia coli]|nr:primary-amine oxidase [Escherichia coli]